MKKFFFLLFAAFYTIVPVFAQAPTIQWQKTIGGSDNDYLTDLQQTHDGGYILGGHSASNISGDKTENSVSYLDYWLVKLDSSGNPQWEKTIVSHNQECVRLLQPTVDGGYILSSGFQPNTITNSDIYSPGNEDCRLIKLNAAGNTQWEIVIGDDRHDGLLSIQPTADSGCILYGISQSNFFEDTTKGPNESECWLMKLDISGHIQWRNPVDRNAQAGISTFKTTTDGGYILGGTSNTEPLINTVHRNPDDLYCWVAKVDAFGHTKWQKRMEIERGGFIISIQQTIDNGYIVAGNAESDFAEYKYVDRLFKYRDYFIVKLDTAGNIQWQKTKKGFSGNPFIKEALDKGYILSAISQPYLGISHDISPPHTRFWLIKLDSTLNTQWEKPVGDSYYKFSDYSPTSLLPTADGGYLLGQYSFNALRFEPEHSFLLKSTDYRLLRLDALGNIQWQKNIGGNEADILNFIRPTTDGSYILGGISKSNISGDKTENCLGKYDYWVIKLAPENAPPERH